MLLGHRQPSRHRPSRAGSADGTTELILAGGSATNRWYGVGALAAALGQDKVTLACHPTLIQEVARERDDSLQVPGHPLEEAGCVLGAVGEFRKFYLLGSSEGCRAIQFRLRLTWEGAS